MTEKYFLSREAQFSRKLDRCIYNFAHQEGFRSEEIYNIVQGGR